MSAIPCSTYPSVGGKPKLVDDGPHYDFVDTDYTIAELRARRIDARNPVQSQQPTAAAPWEVQEWKMEQRKRLQPLQVGLKKCKLNLAQLDKEEEEAEQLIEEECSKLIAAINQRRKDLQNQVRSLHCVKADKLKKQARELQQAMDDTMQMLDQPMQGHTDLPEVDLPDATPCMGGGIKMRIETEKVAKAIKTYGSVDQREVQRSGSPASRQVASRKGHGASRVRRPGPNPQQEVLSSMASLHETYRKMDDVSAQLRRSHNIHID